MPRGRRLPALLAGGPASPAFAEFLSEAPAKVPQIDGNCELKKRPRGKPRGEVVAVLPDEIDHTPHKVKVSIGAERAEVGAARIQRPTRKPRGDQIAHSTGRAVAVAPTGHIRAKVVRRDVLERNCDVRRRARMSIEAGARFTARAVDVDGARRAGRQLVDADVVE